MIYFLKGIVSETKENSVVIDVNDIGYEAIVSHPNNFEIGKTIKLYTYNVIREDENYLVGFPTLEEKTIFLYLIKVKGLGPRSVINCLSATTPNQIINAIASNNIIFLKTLPGIGTKVASQIIFDLKGRFSENKRNPKQYEDVYHALKELGFRNSVIDKVLATINEPDASTEEILRIALNKLRK